MAPRLFSLGRWRPVHLLLGWGTYWVGLLAVTLGPAIPAIMRATGADADKGSMSANVGDGLRLQVAEGGETLWTLTSSMSEVALWVVGPPLVLWAAWLVRRRKPRSEELVEPGVSIPELPLPQANEVDVGRPVSQPADRPGDRAPRSR